MGPEEYFESCEEESNELVDNDAMNPEEEGFLSGLEHSEKASEEELRERELDDEKEYERAFAESKRRRK